MNKTRSEDLFKNVPQFEETAYSVSRGIHSTILGGGKPVRVLADILHGTWLGHPLHSVLTDVVVGSWMLAAVFDLIGIKTRSKGSEQAADTLIALGAVSAVPTALAGVTDFSAAPRRAISSAAAHGLLNTLGLTLYTLSLANRKAGNRSLGVFLSAIGLGIMTVSAWLGGELSYRYRVGVNKAGHPEEPQEWQPVLDEGDLHEQQPLRVDVHGEPVLLYRYGGTVYAIGAVCAHEGGPLEKGKFDGLCVECPWHQSVFSLRDGGVVHGPSTYAQPSYSARIQGGKVEVKLRQGS